MAAGYGGGKTGSALDGQGLPVALYQCKTDYFLRQRGHFTFYKLHFFLLFFFFFGRLTLNLKEEGRQGGQGKRKEEQMKSIFRMLETSGFIFRGPERKLQMDKTLMF